jgi:hypothetical protein
LRIDSDAILTSSVPGKSFEAVAWQLGQITEGRGSLKNAQSFFCLMPESLERRDAFALRETLGFLVLETPDHYQGLARLYAIRQAYSFRSWV